jgi:hypothetical protein
MSIAVRASRLRVHSESTCSFALTRTGTVPGGEIPSEPEIISVSGPLREKRVHRSSIERTRVAQRPRERPAPLGQT